MAVKVQIDASEVEALMRRYPDKMLKLTKKSMRSAASVSIHAPTRGATVIFIQS